MPRGIKITEKPMTLDDVKGKGNDFKFSVIDREIFNNLLDLAYTLGQRDQSARSIEIMEEVFNEKN